jgi:hypothetical protein
MLMCNPHADLEYIDLKTKKHNLSDQDLLLKCVELILSKNKVHHLNDVIEESKKLFNFIKSNDK